MTVRELIDALKGFEGSDEVHLEDVYSDGYIPLEAVMLDVDGSAVLSNAEAVRPR